MSRTSLFSTYRQGENRVTASMLAVFSRLDVTRLERIIGEAMGEASVQLVSFENQATSSRSPTVPDGRISGRFSLWIETKIRPGELSRRQLAGHLRHLTGGPDVYERLLAITPDVEEPPAIAEVGDRRVVWVSFSALVEAITNALEDGTDVVSEREQVLLRELLQMFEDEGLVSLPYDTVVVAAGDAYDLYLRYGAYLCQPGRSFRPGLERMAFYRRKGIEPHIPKIINVYDNVELSVAAADALRDAGEADQRLVELVTGLIERGERPSGTTNKVFILSGPNSPDTMHLENRIAHQGRYAWTQSQRYTRSDLLVQAVTTEDLAE